MHKILFIDTALNGVSIGAFDFYADKQAVRHLETVRGQAEHIIPMIQATIAEANMTFNDLECVITTLGPGSFTGLRLGISAAKSFALALNIPVLGLSTFDAVRLSQPEINVHTAILLETKRSDYYIQIFDRKGLAASDAQALEFGPCHDLISTHPDCTITGDAVHRFTAQLNDTNPDAPKPSQNHITQVNPQAIATHFKHHPESFIDSSDPIYLRGADISKPKKKLREVAAS